MQNKYVADIGDFGKYGLLRAIVPPTSKLGIIWYLVPDETHLNDGKHISYLSNLKYIDCDRQLFAALKTLISSGKKREVSLIEQSGLFAPSTVFYSDYLSYNSIRANTPSGIKSRSISREQWLGKALDAIKDCDVVFLDPDNGLETPSVKMHSMTAPKYVFYEEVKQFMSKTNTLIIYHHLSRNGSHVSQIIDRKKELRELVGGSYDVLSLRFQPYSPRAYFIISNQQDVMSRIEQFVKSDWKQCFELVG